MKEYKVVDTKSEQENEEGLSLSEILAKRVI